MFHRKSPTASPAKHAIYLMAAVVLGLLLSFLAHAAIEIFFLRYMEAQGIPVVFSGGCALPRVLRSFLWILGAVGGLFLGRYRWRKIYIEKVWCQR